MNKAIVSDYISFYHTSLIDHNILSSIYKQNAPIDCYGLKSFTKYIQGRDFACDNVVPYNSLKLF